MAKLYFKIASDWEEVVRLRNEIAKLKQELKGMDSTQSPAAFKALNTQLFASTQRMDELVTKAAHAGAVMEGNFRKKIFDASQTVNVLSEKITLQRGTIQQLKNELSGLKDKYREALKQGVDTSSLEVKMKSTSAKLREQKGALFNLTQEQANARLSVKKLRDEYELYNNDGKNVVATNEAMAISWKKALGVIGGIAALKRLGSEIIRVRGEFQSMQTAIETMVGKDMAGQLIPQIKELAKISPLTMSDMVGAEKMMLGFNIQAEDTIKYLKALSDISMGESGKFNSLTLAFSQMSAAGKLMGQDLNQMINAGFNPLQVIAEKTGKSIATLKEEMSKGALSAEMVQQAFIDATSAGGKFFGMSENASKTINGQISMMQDALDNAFNEMGQKSEGVIMKGIQMTTSLIENYETVGKVLTGLIVTYGAYRTAVMLSTIATSKHTIAEVALTNVRVLARKAQLALNAAMLTNPYVLLAVAVGGLATAMWAMSDSTTAAARAQKEYNDIKEKVSKREQEHKQKIEELLTAARDESLATLTRQKSLEELRKEYPKIFEKYDLEKLKLEDILKLKQQINEEDSKRSVQGRKEDYNSLKAEIAKQQRYLSLIENPILQRNMSKEDKDLLRIYAGNKSYYHVKEELEKNSELLKKHQKDVLDDNISAYKANLKNYSKEKLEAELKLAQSSASKRNGFVVNGMMVKGGDLESIISSINGTLAEKKSPTTYKQDYEKAKKDWEDAKKKLSEIEKDKSKFTSKQYEEAKQREETTEKAYKKLGGVTGSALTKQEKESEKQKKQQQKSSEELLALRRQNQQDEIGLMEEGRKKILQQIDADFEARKAEITKKAHELAEVNKKAGLSGLNSNGLTSEQQAEIDKANKLNADSRAKAESDMYKAEAEAMRNYLKEYGTFQQQKLAIAEEYAEKIRKAQNDGERLILEKQKDTALQQVEIKAIKQSVDWGSVFGEFGAMFKDQLQPTIDKLKSIAQSDEFKSSSLQDQQTLYELISKLEQSNAAWDSDIFQKVSDDMTAYQTAMQNHLKAQERERLATEALARAKRELAAAEQSGNGTDALNAQAKVTEAQLALNAAARDVQDFGAQVQETTSNLQASSTQAVNMFQNLESGLRGLTSGSLQGVGQGLMQLDKLFNKGGITKDVGNALANGFQSLLGKESKASKAISEALGSAGMAGEIISGVLGILDLLKDGFSNIFVSLQDTVFGAVEGILNDVFSGDIIVKPLENSVKHVGTILDTITFGGFSNWLGSGDSDKNLEKDIEYLAQSNQDLKNSLDNLSEKMDKASVADASGL